jgi:tetratricopeptide (TPR) repeat protein
LLRLDIQEGKWEDAAELSDSFLRLNPNFAEARYHNAVAHFQLGNYDQSAESVKKLQEGDQAKEFPSTHHLMGLIHSKKGDFNSAATEFRTYLTARPTSPVSPELQRQINEWEVLGVIKKQETASAAAPAQN